MAQNKDSEQPSAFNMGVSTLNRINYFLWMANEASSQDKVVQWYKAVNTLYKELYPFIKKDEEAKETMKQKKRKVEQAYQEYLDWGNKEPHNRQPNPPREVFDKLEDWELEIRATLDDKELLMKKDPDPSQALA